MHTPQGYGISRKFLISLFILFHWFCVFVWVMPKPSAIKSALLGLSVGKKGIVSAYLYNTVQWQDWGMFAPDPLRANRYVIGRVVYQDGKEAAYGFPRLSKMNYLEATLEKRYRKFQHRIVEERVIAYREEIARYIARRMNDDPANPPVKVILENREAPIPRHDRPEMRSGKKKHVNYARLLRKPSTYKTTALLEYTVKPKDLGLNPDSQTENNAPLPPLKLRGGEGELLK